MKIIEKFFKKKVIQPVEAVANILDVIYIDDNECLSKKNIIYRLQQKPSLIQNEVNHIEIQKRGIFVSGWRPFIGWVCAWNLFYLAFFRDILILMLNVNHPEIIPPPATGSNISLEIIITILGLGLLRTIEKFNGRTK